MEYYTRTDNHACASPKDMRTLSAAKRSCPERCGLVQAEGHSDEWHGWKPCACLRAWRSFPPLPRPQHSAGSFRRQAGKGSQSLQRAAQSSVGRCCGGPPEYTGDPRLLLHGKVCGQGWGDGRVLSRPTPPPSLRNSHGHGDTQYPLLYQTWRRPPISPTSAQSVWGYKDVLLLLITIDCQLEPHLCNLCPSAISGYLQATSFTCRGPRWAMTGEIRA